MSLEIPKIEIPDTSEVVKDGAKKERKKLAEKVDTVRTLKDAGRAANMVVSKWKASYAPGKWREINEELEAATGLSAREIQLAVDAVPDEKIGPNTLDKIATFLAKNVGSFASISGGAVEVGADSLVDEGDFDKIQVIDLDTFDPEAAKKAEAIAEAGKEKDFDKRNSYLVKAKNGEYKVLSWKPIRKTVEEVEKENKDRMKGLSIGGSILVEIDGKDVVAKLVKFGRWSVDGKGEMNLDGMWEKALEIAKKKKQKEKPKGQSVFSLEKITKKTPEEIREMQKAIKASKNIDKYSYISFKNGKPEVVQWKPIITTVKEVEKNNKDRIAGTEVDDKVGLIIDGEEVTAELVKFGRWSVEGKGNMSYSEMWNEALNVAKQKRLKERAGGIRVQDVPMPSKAPKVKLAKIGSKYETKKAATEVLDKEKMTPTQLKEWAHANINKYGKPMPEGEWGKTGLYGYYESQIGEEPGGGPQLSQGVIDKWKKDNGIPVENSSANVA